MDYCFLYGEISEAGKQVWDGKEISPFDILSKNRDIKCIGSWMDALGWARKDLREEVQVDWGSFAWKCFGRDLQKLAERKPRCVIEDFEDIAPEKEYGVVFIEMS